MVFYDVVPPFFGGGVFVLGSTVISWAHKPSGQGWAAVPVDYKPTRNGYPLFHQYFWTIIIPLLSYWFIII
jgi:hypothetical protein